METVCSEPLASEPALTHIIVGELFSTFIRRKKTWDLICCHCFSVHLHMKFNVGGEPVLLVMGRQIIRTMNVKKKLY